MKTIRISDELYAALNARCEWLTVTQLSRNILAGHCGNMSLANSHKKKRKARSQHKEPAKQSYADAIKILLDRSKSCKGLIGSAAIKRHIAPHYMTDFSRDGILTLQNEKKFTSLYKVNKSAAQMVLMGLE